MANSNSGLQSLFLPESGRGKDLGNSICLTSLWLDVLTSPKRSSNGHVSLLPSQSYTSVNRSKLPVLHIVVSVTDFPNTAFALK